MNNIPTTLQSGFIPGSSTINQLVDTAILLTKAKKLEQCFATHVRSFIESGITVFSINLNLFGISGSLLLWFKDYLNDRKQTVVLPGSASSWYLLRPVYLKDLF